MRCPQLVRAFTDLISPRGLTSQLKRLIPLDLNQLLQEIEASGAIISLPPSQEAAWPEIKDYSRYSRNWKLNHVDLNTSFGEYARERRAIILNLKASVFRQSEAERELRLRWTLLHEFGHFWIHQNLYPSSRELRSKYAGAIFKQQLDVVAEGDIEKLTATFSRLKNPEKVEEHFQILYRLNQRTVMEEILIERSLNSVWLSSESDPVGRFTYLAGAVRAYIYSLSNLLEILVRLHEQDLVSSARLSFWQREFNRQVTTVLNHTADILLRIQTSGSEVIFSAPRLFSTHSDRYAHRELRFFEESVKQPTDLKSTQAREFRLAAARRIADALKVSKVSRTKPRS